MKSILIYSPNPIDGVSFYRQWGPLSQFRDKFTLFSFPANEPRELQLWTWYKGYDLAFMSRPHRMHDLYFVNECKKWNVPVWVDYDDAILQIPNDNPVAPTFQGEATKYTIECLKQADVVTVSSTLQKSWFEKEMGLKNVVFIPNAVDDDFLKWKKPFNPNRKVLWRGSQSHLRDLLFFRDDILSAIESRSTYLWLFFGIDPWFFITKETEGRVQYAPSMNLVDFIREVTNYNAQLQIVPLVDHFFNRVKSNLAWLDGTLCGSVCIAPAWEAWDVPGLIKYEGASMKYAFREAFSKSDSELEKLHNASWEYIRENLLLSKVNPLRLELINNLLG